MLNDILCEQIIIAKKPIENTIAENLCKYNVGAINIDECRVEFVSEEDIKEYNFNNTCNERTTIQDGENIGAYDGGWKVSKEKRETPQGRFPSNVILEDSDVIDKEFPVFEHSNGNITKEYDINNLVYGDYGKCKTWNAYQDKGSASRYFKKIKYNNKDIDKGEMNMQENENFKIINGNSLEVLDTLADDSIDAIVTDPPYELGFMGKKWDSTGIAYNVELWKKALRVLKPGGYLLAFGGTRTYHRIACAIEDAGFEIKDCIMWLYGSGFPKSQNVGVMVDKYLGQESIDTGIVSPNARPNSTKDNTLYESGTVGKEFTIKKANNRWDGYGTCLKPAYEPVIMAKKSVDGTIAENCVNYSVGALNINECRVGNEERTYRGAGGTDTTVAKGSIGSGSGKDLEFTVNGRFPANVITDGSEEVAEGFPYSKGSDTEELGDSGFCFDTDNRSSKPMAHGYADEGSAMRFFYCAKASTKDRDEGLDEFESKQMYSLKENTPAEIIEEIKRLLNQNK